MEYVLEKDMTSAAAKWLKDQGLYVGREIRSGWGYIDLVGVSFDKERVRLRVEDRHISPFRGKTKFSAALAKPYIPIHERIVAVELKLSSSVVYRQAYSNLECSTESYVGFPLARAKKVVERNVGAWRHFRNSGIGILGVSDVGCEIIHPATPSTPQYGPLPILGVSERFWAKHHKAELA